MKFYHQVSREWMEARKQFLTASDIKKIIPVTATGRPRKVTDDMYMEVLASKLALVTDDMLTSTGAAARGHLLEPYAIEEANKSSSIPYDLCHWDDIVISHKSPFRYPLGFSPDALDLENQFDKAVVMDYEFPIDPVELGEVKSYGPERFFKASLKDKSELEERWQIAVAMEVCPTIENAYLILYNPDVLNSFGLCIKHYSREDLADEVAMVREAECDFHDWVIGAKDKLWKTNEFIHLDRDVIYGRIATYPGCGN